MNVFLRCPCLSILLGAYAIGSVLFAIDALRFSDTGLEALKGILYFGTLLPIVFMIKKFYIVTAIVMFVSGALFLTSRKSEFTFLRYFACTIVGVYWIFMVMVAPHI